MEQPNLFGKPAGTDSDRPMKRPRTAPLNQPGSATSPALSFGTVSFERKPTSLTFSSTPTNCPLFGTPGLSSSTTPTPSIFGAANLGTPPLPEQQPRILNTKPVTEIPISGKSASESLPEPSAVSTDLLGDNALARDPAPSVTTCIFALPPTGLRMQDPPLKDEEPIIKQEGEGTPRQEPQQEPGLENTAETVQLKTEEVAVIAPAESFDDHGDLTLVVGETQAHFLVCSHSLRRVSATWHDRLYGQSSDPKDREGVHGWVVRLPKDNPDAMRIVLRVAHGNLSEIPAALPRDMLFHLTASCDRHDMMKLLKSCWSGWVQKLYNPPFHPTTFVQQVWIAHKLGHLEWYKETLSGFLCTTLKGHNGGLISETHPSIDFYNDPYLKELGLLKDWEDGRLKIVLAVGDALREALDKLSNPHIITCCSGNALDTCDCAMLGGIHRALYGKHWYSRGAPHWEQDVTISVRRLLTKMERIRTAAIGESRMRKKENAHKACTPWTPFGLEDILRICPVDCAVPIDTAAFQKQAEICGLHIQAAAANRPVASTDPVPRANHAERGSSLFGTSTNQPETGVSLFGTAHISGPTFWALQRAKNRSG